MGETTVRATLAVLLLAGFYLVGAAVIGGLGWLAGWLWLTFPGDLAVAVSVAAVGAVAGLAVPTWRLLRARPEPPDGLTVSEDQAPELFAEVRLVAEAVGTRAPDEIRLVAEANAGVWEDAGLLGLRPGRRYLYFGVPLLQAYRAGEVRAVLAHELGHYSHHHTRLGVLTYRGMRVIEHTIGSVGPRTAAGWILSGYAAVYALVSLAVTRQMELEADRAAVRVAGPAATVRALRELPRIASAWEVFLAGYVRWNRFRGYTPEELLGWYGWAIEYRRAELALAGREPEPPSPWDSHPPIDERIAAIEREPSNTGVPVERSSGTPGLADFLRSPGFDRHLADVAQAEAEGDADRLYAAAARLTGDRRPGLGGVLDLLADGRRAELRQALPPPARVAQGPGLEPPAEDELADLTFAAVASAVVAAGSARWRHTWSEPMTLVRDAEPPAPVGDAELVALRSLVTRACYDAAGVPPLRALLRDLGVEAPRQAPLDTDGHSTGELLLVDELFLLSYGPSGRRRLTIAAFEAGLAAAALAELRLRDRVRLADSRDATVIVGDATPTGDGFLDSLLDRLAAGEPRPAYRWIRVLGPDVADATARRLESRGLYRPGSAASTHPTNRAPYDPDRANRARAAILAGLNTADLGNRDLMLGALLWGTELSAAVLGRTAIGPRFWLGQLARRDQLALAVRTVIGLDLPLPSQNAGG